MVQNLSQVQQQVQQQQQRLTQLQLLSSKLISMSLLELEKEVNNELHDNPALESQRYGEDRDTMTTTDSTEDNTVGEYDNPEFSNEQTAATESDFQSAGGDDDLLPVYTVNRQDGADYEERVYGNTVSFYDSLKEQMGLLELTPRQLIIMEYLIGSLDNDGLLRKDLDLLGDELAINYYIDTTRKEIEEALSLLQTFEPAGIGARSLQECLILQVERMIATREESLEKEKNSEVQLGKLRSEIQSLHKLKEILRDYFDQFMRRKWEKIRKTLHLSAAETESLQQMVHHLNPKPGASLGETEGRSIQQITPDFLIETTDDGHVSFSLTNGEIPELKISSDFIQLINNLKNGGRNLSRSDREGLLYAREKVQRAQNFIDAVRQRQHTLTITMQAIIDWQLRFFQEGNEEDLRPLTLQVIADKTGLDISTISRVKNQKYAQTNWGIFPLSAFFVEGFTTDEGEEVSTRKIKLALKDIIDNEDKTKPLSDQAIAAAIKEKGFNISRRTVNKYREQLHIPESRLRKEIK